MKNLIKNKQFNNAVIQLEQVLKKRWYELFLKNNWIWIEKKKDLEFNCMKWRD